LLDLLLQFFNAQHSRLQFTMEIERDKKISRFFSADISKSCNTRSAIPGDNGESIGMPKICL